MLKKTLTYTDFDGTERTEDFYFNLTKAELTEMELSAQDGSGTTLQSQINAIIESKSGKLIIAKFKEIIAMAYGERSADGRRFMKSDEITANFEGSAAYSELFMELVTNATSAAEFIRGLVPQDLANEAEKAAAPILDSADIPADHPSRNEDKSPSEIARERSEASLQGHKQKSPTASDNVPSLPTVPADPKLPTIPLVTPPAKPVEEMSREELLAHFQSQQQ